MDTIETASLYGLINSNRDFSKVESWGKNQFNSSFPAALCCYLELKSLKANYCTIENDKFVINLKKIADICAISTLSEDIHFSFETCHAPYQTFVKGSIPRTDLVIQQAKSGECLRALEVKLTALPDHTTCNLKDNAYGSEIVVRPDTIVYLACSIIESLDEQLDPILDANQVNIKDWSSPQEALDNIEAISRFIKILSLKIKNKDIPFLLQPVWKTNGKSPTLSDQCLDLFVWSNSGFCKFIADNCSSDVRATRITRHTRTAIWLYKMLYDYHLNRTFDHARIIDELSYNTKNDKAFASSGLITNRYMACNNLTSPRILKNEIKNIILGGGHKLLSPERRFDAIIYNSPELFE